MPNYQYDGLQQGPPLTEYGCLNLVTASYIQSEDGEHPDHICFVLPEADAAQPLTVFGVFKGLSPEADSRDMGLWDFYVSYSDYAYGISKGGIITLPVLEASDAVKCGFGELADTLSHQFHEL